MVKGSRSIVKHRIAPLVITAALAVICKIVSHVPISCAPAKAGFQGVFTHTTGSSTYLSAAVAGIGIVAETHPI
jgi:hypothetical protein